MPILSITTNVPKSKIAENLPVVFSQEYAKLMGKPVQYVACSISSDNSMAFGGSTEPCAIVHLTYLGSANGQKHTQYSKRMSELLKEHFGISSDRYFMHFAASTGENFGYQGGTF